MNTMTGFTVEFFRATNSSYGKQNAFFGKESGTLVNLPGHRNGFEVTEERPAVMLRETNLGPFGTRLTAVPVNDDGSPRLGGTFGGTFIWSIDSAFRRHYPNPIPVHDRFETVKSN